MDNSSLLKCFLESPLQISYEQKCKLFDYYGVVIECNKTTNLTRIVDENDFWLKNVLDTVSLINYINKPEGSLLDIGSGFGVPGIILKILSPKLQVCLLDSSSKKCNFLSYAIKKLNLHLVSVINERAEALYSSHNNYINFFDYVTARAFGHLKYVAEVSLPYLRHGGRLICQKSINQSNEIIESQDHISLLGGSVVANEDIELLNNIKRKIIVIEKIKVTPSGYPRPFNKIKKDLP